MLHKNYVIARFMDFKLSYNYWYNCSIIFLKPDRKHDKALKTVIIHSKTNFCIKFELTQLLKVEFVTKKRQKQHYHEKLI